MKTIKVMHPDSDIEKAHKKYNDFERFVALVGYGRVFGFARFFMLDYWRTKLRF